MRRFVLGLAAILAGSMVAVVPPAASVRGVDANGCSFNWPANSKGVWLYCRPSAPGTSFRVQIKCSLRSTYKYGTWRPQGQGMYSGAACNMYEGTVTRAYSQFK
jgi:hypothetical protein